MGQIRMVGGRLLDAWRLIRELDLNGLRARAEEKTHLQNITFTDRLDYLSAMSNNFAYVQAVESWRTSLCPSGLSTSG